MQATRATVGAIVILSVTVHGHMTRAEKSTSTHGKEKLTSVKNAHHVQTGDIDHDAVKAGGDPWESLVNICVKAAEDALDDPPAGYSIWQRNSLTDTFVSMRGTHRAICVLVKLGDEHPGSVEAWCSRGCSSKASTTCA